MATAYPVCSKTRLLFMLFEQAECASSLPLSSFIIKDLVRSDINTIFVLSV